MSLINKMLGLFLGNKYERDLREINPYIDQIHSEYAKLQGISNDELRELTFRLRDEIKQSIEKDELEIKELREKAEIEEDISKKEGLYANIDEIEKQINVRLEQILDQLLPRASAIVKVLLS